MSNPKEITQIDLCDGKYSIAKTDGAGALSAFRYGEPWRDLTGDKLVGAMFDEIVALRELIAAPRCEPIEPSPKPASNSQGAVQFIVTFNVKDQGQFEPSTVRDALIDGVRRAEDEGHLTSLGDETTKIELASIKQVIGESTLLQFVGQVARLTLSSERDPAGAGLCEHEDSHDALMGLIRQARSLTGAPLDAAGERPAARAPRAR